MQQADLKWEEKRRPAETETNSKAEEVEKQRLVAEQERQARAAAEAETYRKAEEREKQRLAAEQERQARAAEAAEAREVEIQRLAADQERNARAAAQAEASRKKEEAEKQRLAMEEERPATAAAEAETEHKSEQAEPQQVAAVSAAEEQGKRAEAEAQARYAELVSRGNTDANAGVYDKAIADYNDAIKLDPKNILAFIGRGDAYTNRGDTTAPSLTTTRRSDWTPRALWPLATGASPMQIKATYDKALADHNEAIRLDPKSPFAFRNRGVVYAYKGDNDQAIADFNEAIRLDPKSALAFRNRGDAYMNKGDYGRALADYNEAIRLDPKSALALSDRGVVYASQSALRQSARRF